METVKTLSLIFVNLHLIFTNMQLILLEVSIEDICSVCRGGRMPTCYNEYKINRVLCTCRNKPEYLT